MSTEPDRPAANNTQLEDADALYAQGMAHRLQGEPEQARVRLEAALDIFRRLGARPYAARTEQALMADSS